MKIQICLSFLLAAVFATNAPAQQKITINYPNRSGSQLAAVSGEGRRLLPEVRAGCDADFRRDAGGNRDAGERRGADGEFVAGSIDAGRLQRRLAGAGRQFAESRHVRADGRQKHRQREGSEREAHRGFASRRRALRLRDRAAREIRIVGARCAMDSRWARM